jgi:uncharacterized protein
MRSIGCWHGAPDATRALLVGALALLLCGALWSGAATAHTERAVVELAGERFAVEVLRKPDERARGLMFREALAADQGLLFVYQPPEAVSFWMKNVRFAIDILFIGADGRVRNLHAQVPPCPRNPCPTYPSDGPVRYVLEVPAGTAARLGVEAGARFRVLASE